LSLRAPEMVKRSEQPAPSKAWADAAGEGQAADEAAFSTAVAPGSAGILRDGASGRVPVPRISGRRQS